MHAPAPAPRRLLFLRPDAYGDLVLFEPVLRLVRRAWPEAEVAVLIRAPFADIVPLLASEGVRWLTTACNPYRQGPGDAPADLDALRDTVRAFAPDCLVAACAEQTWLEAAVAAFLPGARQVSLGPGLRDPVACAALEAVLPLDWTTIYPEKIALEAGESEWERNLRLAGALLGAEVPRWWPVATVPTEAARAAARILADAGLGPGEGVVCAPAGTANVPIKHWPPEAYGATLAYLERAHGVRALLIGHVAEQAHLETVARAAREGGATPALWTGRDGEMPLVAALVAAGRFYFGNDTGALHLAGALGRPVAAVFGGGTWPRFRPVARRSLAIVQPLACFGCGWDCYFVDAPCVRTIAAASVQRALGEFLDDPVEDRATILEAPDLEPGARALIEAAAPRLRFQREDSTARLRQARQLGTQLATSEADRAARLLQINALAGQLAHCEQESLARLRQIEALTGLYHASETDRAARLIQTEELGDRLRAAEAESLARLRQVDSLAEEYRRSENDRADRLAQTEQLTAQLHAAGAESLDRFHQLADFGTRLRASEDDRAVRLAQAQELAARLEASKLESLARAGQVEELTALLRTSEADRANRLAQVEGLTARLADVESESLARHGQLAELAGQLRASDADREARLADNVALAVLAHTAGAESLAHASRAEELGARLAASDADRVDRLAQVERLTALLQTSDADRVDRLAQVERLTDLLQTSDADRADRLAQVERLTAVLQTSDADRVDRLAQVERLTDLLQTSDADRADRLAQVERLTELLQTSETDRANRLRINEDLSRQLAARAGGPGAAPPVAPESTAPRPSAAAVRDEPFPVPANSPAACPPRR